MTMFRFQCKFRRFRRYLLAPGFFAVVAIVAVLAAAASADTIAKPKENPFAQVLDFKPKLYNAMLGCPNDKKFWGFFGAPFFLGERNEQGPTQQR